MTTITPQRDPIWKVEYPEYQSGQDILIMLAREATTRVMDTTQPPEWAWLWDAIMAVNAEAKEFMRAPGSPTKQWLFAQAGHLRKLAHDADSALGDYATRRMEVSALASVVIARELQRDPLGDWETIVQKAVEVVQAKFPAESTEEAGLSAS